MATVTFEIDDDQDELYIDQADYDGDTIVNINTTWDSVTFETGHLHSLVVTQTSGSSDTLELQITNDSPLAGASPNNILVVGGADVTMTGMSGDGTGSADATTFAVTGSTLRFTPEMVSSTVRYLKVQLLANSTFVYDSTGVASDQISSNVSLTMDPSVELRVVGAEKFSYENGILSFQDADGNTVGEFVAPGIDDSWTLDGDTLHVACYLKGTHIATPDGEVKVETLKAGDLVLTASGETRTVKWLGFRKLNRKHIPDSHMLRVSPIRICKGALAENVPHRDLTVSPGHRFNFDGALVPALSLVNGQTITQDFAVQQFEYFHVELDAFDMLLAEGAVAESYLDVGDFRKTFENAAAVAAHPDFGPAPARVVLPEYVQKITPEIIQPIRRELFKRAEAVMGAVRTADADLRIEVNGKLIKPQATCTTKGVYRFELPAGVSGDIRILSNAVAARETALINRTDTRTIGVGIAAMTLAINGQRCDIDLNDASLTGFNDVQEMEGIAMRWTTGAAVIPASLLPSSSSAAILELDVLRTHMYWREKEGQQLALRAA